MKNIVLTFILSSLIIIGDTPTWAQEKTEQVSGAVIVVALTGQVQLLDQNGNALENRVSVGSVIPIGRFAQTDKGSSLTLLLSNGTVLTVQENSRMKVGSFKQEPFDAKGKKVSDLEEEPSSSQVTLDLDLGALVIKTKKLNRRSSLDINSPVGVAGIRGTEFQMGMQPNGGMQLDVTESTVSFTPPGGQPTMVTQGKGLDVSSTGAMNARPVNPETAQNISDTNDAATQASADVSMDAVSDAMVESDNAGASEEGQSGGTENEPESSEPESGESAPASEIPENSAPNVNMDEIIEQNADVKQVRKTGKTGVDIDKLGKFGFNANALDKFLSMPQAIQEEFMGMPINAVVRLMDMQGFGVEQAVIFLQYNTQTRDLILILEDSPFLSLLAQQLDESLVLGTFTRQNLELSKSSNLPSNPVSDPLEDDILKLGEMMKEDGDSDALENILASSSSEWNAETLQSAELANILTREINLELGFSGVEFLSEEQATQNEFYEEISSLYQTLEDDQIVWGNQAVFLGGKTIDMAEGDYQLPSSLSSAEGFVIGAEKMLPLHGSFSFARDSTKNVRLVLMSGDSLEMQDGSSFKSSLAELVLAARGDVLLQGARLESAREVAIRSMRDVQLSNFTVSTSEKVRIMANRDLHVDGLYLSQNLPSLIMEATTIRLRNIDFPSATQVQLNSLKGAIDGRYPNFGTSVPQAQQLGRVNFLENIHSGGNPLIDRVSFDQFGGNIKIGKLP